MLPMVSYPTRLQSGQITCYLNRTYHVLPTNEPVTVDRIAFFNESVCCVYPGCCPYLKKALTILVALVLAPVLLVSLVAFAAGDWHPLGETASRAQGSVSSHRTLKNKQRTAPGLLQYKEPTKHLSDRAVL